MNFKFTPLRPVSYALIAIFVALALAVFFSIGHHAQGATFRGLTADMIEIALNSAHIRSGSQIKLLDRRTGQWHDFMLRRYSIQASGHRAVIEIDADEVN